MDIQGASALGAVYEPVSALDAAYAFDDSDHLARYFESDAARRPDRQGFADETGVRHPRCLVGRDAAVHRERADPQPDDLDGLRMRFPNSPQFLMNAKALGADATEVAYEELFLALQQGTVDGQENPIVNIDAINLDEVQDYISLSSHQANSNLVIIGEVLGRADRRAAAGAPGRRRQGGRAGPGLRRGGRGEDARRVEARAARPGRRRRRRRRVPEQADAYLRGQLQRRAARGLRGDPGAPAE